MPVGNTLFASAENLYNCNSTANSVVYQITENITGFISGATGPTPLVPTKNLPLSGLIPQKTAGAPSHFVVTFTFEDECPANISRNDCRKLIASRVPATPRFRTSSSICSELLKM